MRLGWLVLRRVVAWFNSTCTFFFWALIQEIGVGWPRRLVPHVGCPQTYPLIAAALRLRLLSPGRTCHCSCWWRVEFVYLYGNLSHLLHILNFTAPHPLPRKKNHNGPSVKRFTVASSTQPVPRSYASSESALFLVGSRQTIDGVWPMAFPLILPPPPLFPCMEWESSLACLSSK